MKVGRDVQPMVLLSIGRIDAEVRLCILTYVLGEVWHISDGTGSSWMVVGRGTVYCAIGHAASNQAVPQYAIH